MRPVPLATYHRYARKLVPEGARYEGWNALNRTSLALTLSQLHSRPRYPAIMVPLSMSMAA
jgi:hypothetical protein